jgi:hypothetical protein
MISLQDTRLIDLFQTLHLELFNKKADNLLDVGLVYIFRA